jgi:hypothetical protein
MIKILFRNEEGLPEIVFSDRVYIDPDAPTDIIIAVTDYDIDIRIRFKDTEEADSFLNDILFECDKVNLKEIADDNPELEVTVEENEESSDFYDMLDNALNDYYENMENDEDGKEA